MSQAEAIVFWAACRHDNVENVKKTIDAGVNINAGERKYGMTGLMLAASRGSTKVVDILLDKDNIKLDATDCIGRTALHYACTRNQVEIARRILVHPTCSMDLVRMRDRVDGETAEMFAFKMGNDACSRIIKEFIANKTEKSNGLFLNNNTDAINENNEEKKPCNMVNISEETGEVVTNDEISLQEVMLKRCPSLNPSCPICLESMVSPPIRIFNCGNGHLICSICKPKVKECYCKAKYTGRATAVEQMIREVFDIE